MFRYFFNSDRMDAVFGYQAGSLDHIFICQSWDASVIFYGQYQIFSFFTLHTFDAVQHNPCISHTVRYFQLAFFQQRTFCQAGLDAHVGVLTNLHIIQEDLQCAFRIGVDIHMLQFVHHLNINVLDGLSSGCT